MSEKVVIIKEGGVELEGFTKEEICALCKALGEDKDCPKKLHPEMKDVIGCTRIAYCG